MKKKLSLFIIIGLAGLPLIPWFLMLPLASRFTTLTQTLTSFGQMFGLVGMTLFSLSLILSSRGKILDDWFGGLNLSYINHHLLGGLAFILLLFHPLFLSLKIALISLRAAALFLLPGSMMVINFGIFSLLLMVGLLVVTFFSVWKYQLWKQSHKFLGLAFFLGSLHAAFIPSDISRNLFLRTYILGLSAIALICFVRYTLLGWWLVKKFDYKIKSLASVGQQAVVIVLKSLTQKMNYQPGQFIFISFHVKNFSPEVHPFSIASGPDEDLKIIVKHLGDYTGTLKNLSVGDLAKVEGPYGKFTYTNYSANRQIWIAGGIGITPFLGMAKAFALSGSDMKVDLYYCVKTEDELIMYEELMALSAKQSNFRVISFCSVRDGYLNVQTIADKSGNLKAADILLCGPPAMMHKLRREFINFGLTKKQIHSEEFKF